MKSFRSILTAIILAVMPIAAMAQNLTPTEAAELEQVRLTEDLLSRLTLFADAAKSGEITMDTSGPAPTTLTEMADRLAASPSVNAYLIRIGLTPKELMLGMAAIFQATEDYLTETDATTDLPVDSLSPRQANLLFYRTHKAEMDALLGGAPKEASAE